MAAHPLLGAPSTAPWKALLQKSLAQNAAPAAKYLQLGTVRPDGRPAVRTVVFRGFLGASDHLTFVTDRRSSKIADVAANRAVELCWYFATSREQFRLAGMVDIVSADAPDAALAAARQEAWARMSDAGSAMLEQSLQRLSLSLDDGGAKHAAKQQAPAPLPVPGKAVRHVQEAFGELLATSPSTLIKPAGGGDSEQEARMWDAFAEVYEREVTQQQAQARGGALPKDSKRQILADILVWAEITQSHYDPGTASFVTEPHGDDASFQRIGKLLKAAKAERGL
ncbi:PPOX2 [Scenedesmus sp. PABB004]|nr:PPOX2 [Scenedesmus sp. PABB004]